MKQSANFYKIGLFTLLGLALFIILLLMMGGRSLFSHPVYVETYFNESVQGLEIGSSVKYRGVQIGKVANIDFVNDIYKKNINTGSSQYFSHYIYVLMAINLDLFAKQDQQDIQSIFQQAINEGMRARLAPEGLTGASYLELDFYDPKDVQNLKINWRPEHPYIPSESSTLSQITTNLSKLAENLSESDFKSLIDNINRTAKNTNAVMARMNTVLADQQQNIEASITNMRVITTNLRGITDNAKSYPSSLIFGKKPPKLDLDHDQEKN